MRRVGSDDLPEIREVVRRVHDESRDCGPIEFPEHVARYWMTKEPQFAYLAEDGYLEYNWNGAETLYVDYAVAPHDPVRWLTREPAAVADRQRPWMPRIADAPAAIAGRGQLTLTERGAPLRLSAGGFASLYADTPVSSLRRAGLARDGDPDRDALLDAVFAATTYCLDYV